MPPSEKQLTFDRRNKIANSLLETITSPDSPVSREELGHFRLVAAYFNAGKAIDAFIGSAVDRPELHSELLVSMIVECLNRLLEFPEKPPKRRRKSARTCPESPSEKLPSVL